MFTGIRELVIAVVICAVSACAQYDDEDYLVLEPELLSIEPVYNGKYK